MVTRIVSIGNSKGIRIPKPLLREAGIGEEVDIIARNNSLIIRNARKPRAKWAEAFEQMTARNDDRLLDDVVSLTSFDEDEWEW
jgi:antitoxin MazE